MFDNDVNQGTFLVLSSDLPKTDCELVESIFHGNASIVEPHKRNNTKEHDPTILIVRNDETYQEHKESLELFGCFRGLKQHLFGVFRGLKYGRTFLEFSGALNSQKFAISGA